MNRHAPRGSLRRIAVIALAIVATLAGVSDTAHAAPAPSLPSETIVPQAPLTVPVNLLGNGGFEAPAVGGLGRTFGSGETFGTCTSLRAEGVGGACWHSSTTGLITPVAFHVAAEGRQSLDIGASAGELRQAVTLQPGTRYSFSVRASRVPGALDTPVALRVSTYSSAGKARGTFRATQSLPFVDEWSSMRYEPTTLSFTTPAGTSKGVVAISTALVRPGYVTVAIDDARLLRG
jgi:hypothetical protein